jgi:hypothetical protein
MALELQGKLLQYVPKASAKDAPQATSVAEGDQAVVDKVADKVAESV